MVLRSQAQQRRNRIEDYVQNPNFAEVAQRSARTFSRGDRYLCPGWAADDDGSGGGDPLGAVAHKRDSV